MNTPEINILFLGGAKRVSMARKFIRAGERLGITVNIYGYELSKNCALACVAAEIVEGEKWSSPSLYSHIHRIVVQYGIKIIVPFVDGAVAVASNYCLKYGDAWTPTSSPDIAELMFDKVASSAAFEKAGLPIPVTIDAKNPRFPLIAKPRHGSASKGIIVVNGLKEWNNADLNADDYILQEYIADKEEYTVDCYVSTISGQHLVISPRLRIETSGGEVTSTLTVDSPEIVALARQCLDAIGLRGAVTVQILRDKITSRLMIMEVNPRLGGGAVATIVAGGDIPAIIISEGCGLTIQNPITVSQDILVQRYLDETAFNIKNEHR